MKKFSLSSLIIGIVIGSVLFGGIFAVAASVTATTSTWDFYVDGAPTEVEAYSIDGSNYLKLRDVFKIADVGVWYDADKREVYIERDKGYDPDYAGPTATESDPSQTPSLPINNEYSIGENIKFLDGTEVKVTQLTETTNYVLPNGSGYPAGDGKKYVRIDFEMLSDKQPDNGRYILPLGFISEITTNDGVNYNISTILGDAPNILPNERSTAYVFFLVESGDVIERIKVSSTSGSENAYVLTGSSITMTSETATNQKELTTVYWVTNGDVYHSTRDCRSLARSTNIMSGTIAESGKSKGCSNCVR